MCRVRVLMGMVLCGWSAFAETNNPATDWFSKAGYGVFVHYLNDIQNSGNTIQSLGRSTTWDECVREFDADRFAAAMAEAGAGYVIFTTHQRTRFLIAPNATFDRVTGYKPGEACATRDLIEDLYQALHKKNIPLMLYWTGNGPSADGQANAAMGWQTPVSKEWLAKWAAVTEEYGVRYGDKVVGWWVDGCYFKHGNLQYDDEKLGILARALKAGNPKRIVGLNPGVELTAYSRHEDFTAGEQNRFHDRPTQRWLNGEQWHVLSFLGVDRADNYLAAGWGEPGVRYGKQELAEYIFAVNQAGGVISIDVMLFRDGGLDRSQLEVLKSLRPSLAGMKALPSVPPGNLAFRKPALLLSLDGSRELQVNGGGGPHMARLGVDGDPGTTALASGEWPWTYEVDLLEPFKVQRVKATFGRAGYATQLRVQVSPDRAAWQTVGAAENPTGQPFEVTFAPAACRYVRVSGLKPDGPDQPGTQMAVAELEVYE